MMLNDGVGKDFGKDIGWELGEGGVDEEVVGVEWVWEGGSGRGMVLV